MAERDHEHHKTALHWAAENGNEDIGQLLLEWGSSIASQDQYGETPLHYAAESGYTKIVEILLKRGAELGAKDDRDRTALRCARDNYHIETVKVMLSGWEGTKAEAEEKDKQNKSLAHWTAEIGDAKLWHKLRDLDLSADAMAPDERGWTPAQYAVKSDNQTLIGMLNGS